MSVLEQFSYILSLTYKGTTTKEVIDAEKTLSAEYCNPNFIELIFQLLSTTQDESLLKAGIIQIRFFLENNKDKINEQILVYVIQNLINLPPKLLPVFEIISSVFVEFIIELKQQSQFLQTIFSLLNSSNPVFGFIILYDLLDQNTFEMTLPNYEGVYDEFFSQELKCIKTCQENEIVLYTLCHYYARAFNIYANSLLLKSVEQFHPCIELSLQVFDNAINSNSTYFDVTNDFLEIILTFLHSKSENFTFAALLLEKSMNFMQNSPSYYCVTTFFKVLNYMSLRNNIFEQISGYLSQIIQMLIKFAFEIFDDEKLYFENDPRMFIDTVLSDNEEDETPRSLAKEILTRIAMHQKELFNSLLEIVMQSLDKNNDSWNIFSIILFFSSCSMLYIEKNDEITNFYGKIYDYLWSNDFILVAASLLFISNFPIMHFDSIHNFFERIIAILSFCNVPEILYYLSGCAAGHILICDSIDKSSIDTQLIEPAIQHFFVCCERLPTKKIEVGFANVVRFFHDKLGDGLPFCLYKITELFMQYTDITEEDLYDEFYRSSAESFSRALERLCPFIETINPALFNEILTRIEYMIRNMDDLYSDSLDFLNDELLPILEGIVLHEQTIVPKVILIPNLLSSLMENNPYPIVELVSKILKIFSFRFSPHITPKGLQKMLISPILDIIDTIIEHFNIDARFAEKDSGPDHHDDFQGLITLLEILFLLIQIDECVKTHILGIMIPFVYQNIHHFETGSIIAVLAHQDPTILFDDLLFMRWTTSAQNKVYLSSVESILKSTEKPKFEFFIPKMIYYAFVSLFEILSEGYVSDENDEFFNMDSIKNFFTPDSLVNYTNPYLIEQFLIYHNKLPNNKQEDLNDFDFKGEEAT